VYPDCSVICGEPRYWREQDDVIVNPSLVVGVLSRSTEKYDRGDKSVYYRSIPSLREILLVSQDQTYVEQFVRNTRQMGPDGTSAGWIVDRYTEASQKFSLLSRIEIEVGEIYRGILN
jgi:Uma2 family endonuclease